MKGRMKIMQRLDFITFSQTPNYDLYSIIHVHNLRFHNPNLSLRQPISSPEGDHPFQGTIHRLTYQSSRPPKTRSCILGALPRACITISCSCLSRCTFGAAGLDNACEQKKLKTTKNAKIMRRVPTCPLRAWLGISYLR